MAEVDLAGGATGNSGVLASNTKFVVEDGRVSFSTDSGTSKDEIGPGERLIFSGGVTVTWTNLRPVAAHFSYDPI